MFFDDKQGIVLALGGGGARGLAHVGVLDELARLNIPIAGIVGVSAGALAGAGFAAGYHPREMAQRVLEFSQSSLASDPLLRYFLEKGNDSQCTGLVDRVGRLFCQGRVVKSFLMEPSVLCRAYFSRVTAFFLPERASFREVKASEMSFRRDS